MVWFCSALPVQFLSALDKVRGAESGLVADETLERMKRVGKQFSWVDVPGAGHVVSVDKPQEFIQVTQPFLGVQG